MKAPVSLRDRRVQRAHSVGDHSGCEPATCDWLQKPAWVRLAMQKRLRAKDLGGAA